MWRSECCGGDVDRDYDICHDCLEHCDAWFDGDEDDEQVMVMFLMLFIMFITIGIMVNNTENN